MMNKFARFLAVLCLAATTGKTAWGYHVALKDGRIIEFREYRVTEKMLFYTNDQGKESSVPLSSVDLGRTQQLNASENPPLDLPGLIHSSSQSSSEIQPTLGDVARRLRKKDAVTASKRVITNDDVPSTSSGDTTSSGRTRGGNPESPLRTMSDFFDMDRVTLGKAVLRLANIDERTPFPERSDWEFALYDAKQEMARESIHAHEHPNDVQEQKLADRKFNEFEATRSRGIQQAHEYAKYHTRQ